MKKENIKLGIVVVLLLSCLGGLYYYFFIRTDTNWMFWKSNGESISWDDIEYDDDFFPTDSTEVYGEFGEWKFREFKPIYAGYGTTSDGLDFLIGKYLDEDGKEQTVNILVSGEGMVEYPMAGKEFASFFNDYFRDSVAIRGENWDPILSQEFGDLEESIDDVLVPLDQHFLYACPEEVVLSYEDVKGDIDSVEVFAGQFFVEEENLEDYCEFYKMYYNARGYSEILYSFETVVYDLEVSKQISVWYLESEKSFEECKYDYEDHRKIFCANQYLNETYEDFLVGIYIELE